jgi:hypothetical protein
MTVPAAKLARQGDVCFDIAKPRIILEHQRYCIYHLTSELLLLSVLAKEHETPLILVD